MGIALKGFLIKRTSLKRSSFGNAKAPQSIYLQNKHYKYTSFKFNRRHVFKFQIVKQHTQLQATECQHIYPKDSCMTGFKPNHGL